MMPSSPGYVRNYAEEDKTSRARGDPKRRALRNRARRLMVKKGLVKPGDGKDVDHIQMLSKGGSGLAPSNLRVATAHDNRSFARNPSGSAKNNK